MKPRYKITINYKSGIKMTVYADEFNIKRNSVHGLTSADWENLKPRPLFLGIDDIESIWVNE